VRNNSFLRFRLTAEYEQLRQAASRWAVHLASAGENQGGKLAPRGAPSSASKRSLDGGAAAAAAATASGDDEDGAGAGLFGHGGEDAVTRIAPEARVGPAVC
jgi:hypothetical protein